MLVEFPGEVVNELPIHVGAAPGIRTGCSEGREARDADLGQTVVLGAGARIQPDGGGVEGVVLGKEGFVEAVITEAHFVDLGERKRGEIGDGQED